MTVFLPPLQKRSQVQSMRTVVITKANLGSKSTKQRHSARQKCHSTKRTFPNPCNPSQSFQRSSSPAENPLALTPPNRTWTPSQQKSSKTWTQSKQSAQGLLSTASKTQTQFQDPVPRRRKTSSSETSTLSKRSSSKTPTSLNSASCKSITSRKKGSIVCLSMKKIIESSCYRR